MIFTTASLGSYFTVRSLNAIIGYYSNYYNAFIMADLKEKNLLVTMNNWYWAYAGLFYVLFVTGIVTQFICWEWDKKEEVKEKALRDKFEARRRKRRE